MTAESYCAQVLWRKHQMEDYGLYSDHIPINCDNTNAINLSKNLIQYLKIKYIEIRHHFLRDNI